MVARTDGFAWTDAAWLQARAGLRPAAGADFRLRGASRFVAARAGWGVPDWDALADTLVPYAAGLGFTHLELLPITEHPLDASWGYQPVGLFAPTARFGRPPASPASWTGRTRPGWG